MVFLLLQCGVGYVRTPEVTAVSDVSSNNLRGSYTDLVGKETKEVMRVIVFIPHCPLYKELFYAKVRMHIIQIRENRPHEGILKPFPSWLCLPVY